MGAFGDKDASNPTAYTFVLVCSILNALTLVFGTFRLHRRMLLHARRKHEARQLPGSPDAAGVANAASGSPPPKRRRISLTPASLSRVGCFLTPSPGGKLARLQQALPRTPASRRACAARCRDSSPAAAPGSDPAAAAAPGAAPAAAPAALGATARAKLEERRHRRRRLAAMIAAAKAAVEAGRSDLDAHLAAAHSADIVDADAMDAKESAAAPAGSAIGRHRRAVEEAAAKA